LDLGVGARPGRVDVVTAESTGAIMHDSPDRTPKQERILRDQGDPGTDLGSATTSQQITHRSHSERLRVQSIDQYTPTTQLHRPHQRLGDTALACAGSSDDPDLLTGLDCEVETLENQRQIGAIPQFGSSELDSTLGGPLVLRWIGR
jgi:hypothetical protein